MRRNTFPSADRSTLRSFCYGSTRLHRSLTSLLRSKARQKLRAHEKTAPVETARSLSYAASSSTSHSCSEKRSRKCSWASATRRRQFKGTLNSTLQDVHSPMAGTVPSHLTTRRQRLRTISMVLPNIWASGNTVFTVGATAQTGRGYPRKAARRRRLRCGLGKQPPGPRRPELRAVLDQYQQQWAKLPPPKPIINVDAVNENAVAREDTS
jgi:hypothetical protein